MHWAVSSTAAMKNVFRFVEANQTFATFLCSAMLYFNPSSTRDLLACPCIAICLESRQCRATGTIALGTYNRKFPFHKDLYTLKIVLAGGIAIAVT
jgi:hypothetical protein